MLPYVKVIGNPRTLFLSAIVTRFLHPEFYIMWKVKQICNIQQVSVSLEAEAMEW